VLAGCQTRTAVARRTAKRRRTVVICQRQRLPQMASPSGVAGASMSQGWWRSRYPIFGTRCDDQPAGPRRSEHRCASLAKRQNSGCIRRWQAEKAQKPVTTCHGRSDTSPSNNISTVLCIRRVRHQCLSVRARRTGQSLERPVAARAVSAGWQSGVRCHYRYRCKSGNRALSACPVRFSGGQSGTTDSGNPFWPFPQRRQHPGNQSMSP